MLNQLLPEDTPEHRPPAANLHRTEPAAATETMVQKAHTNAEQAAWAHLLWRRQQRRLKWINIRYALMCAAFLGMVPTLLSHLSQMDIEPRFYSVLLIFVVVLIVNAILRTHKPLLNNRDMAEIDGAGAAGPLLDMLESSFTLSDRFLLFDALQRCLVQIRATDISRLNARQYSILLDTLRVHAAPPTTDTIFPDFCIATLKALEQIGDASALPLVEEIAYMGPHSIRQQRICSMAAECLPLLRVWAGLVAESKTLLRASALETVRPDEMMRASSGPSAAKPDELLRPNDEPPA